MTDFLDFPATRLGALIATKEISPSELLEASIARYEAVNPVVNAVVATDFEAARVVAASADRAVLAGEQLGPLHGLPVGIKDLNLTKDLRTTFGSPLFAEFVPDQDEGHIAAIRRAGGIIIGKTNTPEFGAGANTVNAVYGATRNPFDPRRTCGGSSGGSAVALATGMIALATGSDTGGSLRIPAAYCGVAGFRPSPGMVPSERRQMPWSPVSVLGPLGRSVGDLEMLLCAMSYPDPLDPLSLGNAKAHDQSGETVALDRLRVAISEDLGFAPISNSIGQTFQRAVSKFRSAFGEVTVTDPPLGRSDEIFEILRGLQFVVNFKDLYDQHPDQLGPNIVANMKQGLGYTVVDIAWAHGAHAQLYRDFVNFMKDFDILICPTVSVPPFPVERLYQSEIDGMELRSYFHWIAVTYGLTLTAHPVVAVPCGLDATGAPFGIQVCGKAGCDREVLAIAKAIEGALAGISLLAPVAPDLVRLKVMGEELGLGD